VKERNQISTRAKERDRLNAGYGGFESDGRMEAVCVLLPIQLPCMLFCDETILSLAEMIVMGHA
jgi:hypothetical protein